MQFTEVKDEFEWIPSGEIDQVYWDRAGNARLLRVDNVIIIIAKMHVAAILNLEFIEVILGPAKDLEYYSCKLFESRIVRDLKLPIPIGMYEFGISRILASILYAEFEASWGTLFPLGRSLLDLDQLFNAGMSGARSG